MWATMTRHIAGLLLLTLSFTSISADYWENRAAFIKSEDAKAIGNSIVLNEDELKVNSILMKSKLKECEGGYSQPRTFLPARHFFDSREDIERSDVFKFIQKVPKGASLHGHDTALASGEYVFNLTYRENLYGCIVNNRLMLKFFATVQDNSCQWSPLQKLRQQHLNFDEYLKTQLTIIVDNPNEAYPDINTVWNTFTDTFGTVQPLLVYKPIFKEYFYQVLKELHEDNVKYIEFRSTLPTVYDLQGNEYGPLEVAGLYKETLDEFMRDYPDFIGARFIYSPMRFVNNLTDEGYLQTIVQLKQAYPNFVAGFDLVGQEDLGRPLVDFISTLQKISGDIKFFFHAGETNWYGTSTDENLVDAVLLGTTRIGHGFALNKHPQVKEIVKKRNIAIEVSPISNQVLKLVDDQRNHPAATMIAEGLPIVICNDDPSFWGAKALSYDWYMAFMGLASLTTDLRFLKQLAINSIKYSAMPEDQKVQALSLWTKDWNNFIRDILNQSC